MLQHKGLRHFLMMQHPGLRRMKNIFKRIKFVNGAQMTSAIDSGTNYAAEQASTMFRVLSLRKHMCYAA